MDSESIEPERGRLTFGSDGWAWACVICAFQRGTSYLFRPPETNTRTENVIEHFVSYSVWGWIILSLSIGISVCLMGRCRILEIVCHILCASVYSLLGLSVVLSALALGQPWAASGALVFIALVHLARVRYLARRIQYGEAR